MRVRVGDLAIAKFDPGDGDIKAGRKWDEMVCLVTGTNSHGPSKYRYYEFIYWDGCGSSFSITKNGLPTSRLVRVRPKKKWDGALSSLKINDVETVA
ncbi:hypothetical protein LCGC14_0220840 [marine sediment metagenome]|uniref:Uncharacterized protein n=1 Tax=marine sediment metagenome TaxID=412755 RepID=A0A0F9WXQ1_9ZZZZ